MNLTAECLDLVVLGVDVFSVREESDFIEKVESVLIFV